MTRIDEIPLFDPGRYLDTSEARAEYLTAALEDGTADEIRHALTVVAGAVSAHDVGERSRTEAPVAEFAAVVRLMRSWGITLSAAPLTPVG